MIQSCIACAASPYVSTHHVFEPSPAVLPEECIYAIVRSKSIKAADVMQCEVEMCVSWEVQIFKALPGNMFLLV